MAVTPDDLVSDHDKAELAALAAEQADKLARIETPPAPVAEPETPAVAVEPEPEPAEPVNPSAD